MSERTHSYSTLIYYHLIVTEQSLNGNANAVATSSASQGSQAQAQAQDHPFGSWYSALSSGLNYLFGTSSSRFEYPHLIGNITKYLFGGETTNVRDRSTTWYTGPYDYYNPYYYYPFNYDHFNLYRG
ncbi:unnamed protein product [Litomosoides sigmodontis]|uniref:Uncharacterized protein n=1 Tax=Litomosoides sigmodontis TaxID=42156 RepID=A0A3P6V1L9_LITSI|nr:unnamed protein product [Litomosoides sigmodontis]